MKEGIKALKTNPEALFVLGYMLLPLFALVFAGLGLFLIITGSKIVGLILILTITQLFAFGSLKAVGTRKRLLAEQNKGTAG